MEQVDFKPDKRLLPLGSRFFGFIGRRISGWRKLANNWSMLLLLSLVVISLELVFHLCGEIFFDPFSRWDDLASILFILTVAVLWNARSESELSPSRPAPAWLQICRGMALVIGAYWAIAFGVLCIVGTLGSVFAGLAMLVGFPPSILFTASIGVLILLALILICLNPVWVWISLLQTPKSPSVNPQLRKVGLILGALLLGIKLVPAVLANIAFSSNSLTLARSPLVPDYALRHAGAVVFHDSNNLIGSLFQFGSNSSSPEEFQRFYYQSTGKVFSDQDAPVFSSRRSSDLPWGTDRRIIQDQGGDEIGNRIDELTLERTELLGRVDPAAHLVNWEWTFEFKNTDSTPHEARMKILLPPGAVTTRLNLWIDGEWREAAFDGTEKVAAAYKKIVVVERKDPVLARWIADDELLVQCFPVPADGGEMKIRFACTSEIHDQRFLVLPQLIHENFQLADDLPETARVTQAEAVRTHGETTSSFKSQRILEIQALPAATPVYSEDRFASEDESRFIQYTPGAAPTPPEFPAFQIVVDQSAAMAEHQDELLATLRSLEEAGIVAKVYLVGDRGFGSFDRLAEAIESLSFAGGRDNIPALVHASKEARKSDQRVLWLHAPHPISLGNVGKLRKSLSEHPPLFCAQFGSGEATLIRELGQKAERIRIVTPSAMSSQILDRLEQEFDRPGEWLRLASAPSDGQVDEASGQLTRWWAWEKLKAESTSSTQREKIDLAARYQLVTPDCSAVVLETAAQYKEAGLSPVANGTIPEPSSTLLILISGCAALLRRQREGA